MKIANFSGLVANGRITAGFIDRFKLPAIVAVQIAQLYKLGYEFSEVFMEHLTTSRELQGLFKSERIMTAATETGFDNVMKGLNRGLKDPFIVYYGTFALQQEVLMDLMEEGAASCRVEDYQRALETYDEILLIDPSFLGALIGRGTILLYAGELEGAQEDLGAAAQKLETYKSDPTLFKKTYRNDNGRFVEHVVSTPAKLYGIHLKLAEVWNKISMLWNEKALKAGELVEAASNLEATRLYSNLYRLLLQKTLDASRKARDSLLEQRGYAIALKRDTLTIDENLIVTLGVIRDLRGILKE